MTTPYIREVEEPNLRQGENGEWYELNDGDAAHWDWINETVEADADYWKEIGKFIKERGFTSTTRRPRRVWTGLASGWSKTSWKKGSLSDWWTGGLSGHMSGSSDQITRLALAISAVQTVVRVVHDNDPPVMVRWAVNGQSYTDFSKSEVHINPKPVSQAKLKDGDAVDVVTGFGLHESSHCLYTRPVWKAILEPTKLSPVVISALLANVLEDVRIEQRTVDVFPGFSYYFDKASNWLWSDTRARFRLEYGPELNTKINFVIAATKWPGEIESDVREPGRSELAKEFDWWRAWLAEYPSDPTVDDLRVQVQKGLDHLRLPTESEPSGGGSKAGEDMDKITKGEKEAENWEEALKKWLEEHKDEILEFCSHPDADDGIDYTEEAEVERLVDEELREVECPVPMKNGRTEAKIYVTKPRETDFSRMKYIGSPGPMLARIRAALKFRQELPRYSVRLEKEGLLDEEELWRFAAGDYRLFEEHVIASHPQTQMTLLVDCSGSMNTRSKLPRAQELAQLFVWALRDMENVTTKVFGHSGNVVHGNDCQIYRFWEPGDPMSRLGLISAVPHMNNYDSFAIGWCAKEITERGQPNEQRLLFVLSDGLPQANGYGGRSAMDHVAEVVAWGKKNGVRIIQIAIDDALDPHSQSYMFKEWIAYARSDEAKLPLRLAKLLAKLT